MKSITTLQTFTLELDQDEIEVQALFKVTSGYTCRQTAVYPIDIEPTAEMIGELQYLDGTELSSLELQGLSLFLGLSDAQSLYTMLEKQVLERSLDWSEDGQYTDED